MKYEVYCRLNLEEYIEVDAEDEDEASIEAKTIFSENIALSFFSKNTPTSIGGGMNYYRIHKSFFSEVIKDGK